MPHTIKTLYVIHHSHTDIGYTDLQERVIDTQTDYIHTVLSWMDKPKNQAFRWNCESLFCVEEFFKTATEQEKERFCVLASQGKIGLSASYLNFTDLLDSQVYSKRLAEWQSYFRTHGGQIKTAMIADINGISMGCRDAMLENGVEFLFTNIHCHHGMYPLYRNQTAFWWENAAGQRLLVWNGEHYNLGNVLGLKSNRSTNFMMQNHLGNAAAPADRVEALHKNVEDYLNLCEENGYPYDFIVTAVSGVFSDNAPPSLEILENIQGHNSRYGEEFQIKMVSLQELYAAIGDSLRNAPVYRGDLTDWWANGVGSTPYAVKHYKDAVHRYQLCQRLDPQLERHYPELCRTAQDNLMLYAEHTWGHSATITNPYDTMALNLDMRKNSYASKAHEAASRMLDHIAAERGDILRYYNTSGTVRVCSTGRVMGPQPVEFYIESPILPAAQVTDGNGRVIPCQVSPHPRGRKISFVDSLPVYGERCYTYREIPAPVETLNSRKCYVGAERVRDIINDYDPETYRLPFGFENKFFRLSYQQGKGITSFVDKRTGRELLGKGEAPFFTPMYQRTKVRRDCWTGCPEEQERRHLGRNIRGPHAELFAGKLEEVHCVERGPVFTLLRLVFSMPGSIHTEAYLKFYAAIARVDFRMELGKTISTDIESIFLPLSLDFEDGACYLRKGTEAFRPGIDQIPGTCMEFYMSDHGLAYLGSEGGALIATRDTPLVYQGEMNAHPIRLCQGLEEDNRRPMYSWVMNNNWETNFKMDLSGFCEFSYSLWLTQEKDPEAAMNELRERTFDPYVLMIG